MVVSICFLRHEGQFDLYGLPIHQRPETDEFERFEFRLEENEYICYMDSKSEFSVDSKAPKAITDVFFQTNEKRVFKTCDDWDSKANPETS